MIGQINWEYQAKEENIKGYLGRTRKLISQFAEFKVEKIPRLENCEADKLAKMASFCATQSIGPITIEYIPTPRVNLPEQEEVRLITAGIPWMQPIIRYLRSSDLLSYKSKVRRLKYKIALYCLIDDTLYRREFTFPYLKFLGDEQAKYVMREIHKEIYGNHYEDQSFA